MLKIKNSLITVVQEMSIGIREKETGFKDKNLIIDIKMIGIDIKQRGMKDFSSKNNNLETMIKINVTRNITMIEMIEMADIIEIADMIEDYRKTHMVVV